MSAINEFLNYWVWHVMYAGVPVAFGALFTMAVLEFLWLRRLYRALGAVESLAVLSFVHSWRPIYHAWSKAMGDMRVDVHTRGYHFSFDPTDPQRKTKQQSADD